MTIGSLTSATSVLLCLTLFSLHARSQGLEQFQWKNRILLLLSHEINAVEMQNQLQLFDGQKKELDDRKLKIILISPEELKSYPTGEIMGISSQKIYKRFKKSKKPLEHVLIGLDGTVKLHGINDISPKKLYSIIDVMPMRRSELDKSR